MHLKTLIASFLFLPMVSFAQTDFNNVIKGGELILSGLSIFKVVKSDGKRDSKTIKVCV